MIEVNGADNTLSTEMAHSSVDSEYFLTAHGLNHGPNHSCPPLRLLISNLIRMTLNTSAGFCGAASRVCIPPPPDAVNDLSRASCRPQPFQLSQSIRISGSVVKLIGSYPSRIYDLILTIPQPHQVWVLNPKTMNPLAVHSRIRPVPGLRRFLDLFSIPHVVIPRPLFGAVSAQCGLWREVCNQLLNTASGATLQSVSHTIHLYTPISRIIGYYTPTENTHVRAA